MIIATEPEVTKAALIRSAQGGDRAAFGRLYEQYERLVHGVLLAYVPYADAEDVMQDVFVKAMEQLSTLREPRAFSGWLLAIARRAAIDYARSRKPQQHLRAVEEAADGGRIEALAALEAIQRLPLSYRETLILRFVEGMTGPEIAARTGLTHDSVRVNLCRGMKLLRGLLSGGDKA